MNVFEKEAIEVIAQRLALCVKDVLTVKEASQYTGVSTGTLSKLMRDGDIPFSIPKGLKSRFLRRSELDKWLMANSGLSPCERETKADNFVRSVLRKGKV